MENYKVQKRLGDGTYGCVYKATNTKSGEVVAIKKFKRKYTSWDECMQLREIKALRKLTHPNIIKLKEVLKVSDELNLVFEFLEKNVFEVYMDYKNKGERIPEQTIKSIIRQVVEGLAYMHKHGYFHRDLKPENLLMYGETVKICDFGLAREVRSRPPYTDYVATRWYRAPEILLKQTNYNSPVDIFAVGCIMAELYMLAPLFDGKSEIDQIMKICQILGSPNNSNWPEAQKLAAQAGITFPQAQPVQLEKLIPNASVDAIAVIQDMLKYDPARRPSAQQVLASPFFAVTIPVALPSTQFKNPAKPAEERINFGKLGEAKLGDTKSNFYDVGKKKDEKFRDSTQNFLDFLDKKLAEEDKQWNKVDKKKESGTRERFNVNNKPMTLHQQNSKEFISPDDALEKEMQQDDPVGKRNNPFKLLKYNDPILNGSTSVNHHYDPMPIRQQKPLSMIHANQYSQSSQFQLPLPYMPAQDPSPVNYSKPTKPLYYQNRIHQNYGRIGEGVLGNRNNKFDEFGFTKQQPPNKYGNY